MSSLWTITYPIIGRLITVLHDGSVCVRGNAATFVFTSVFQKPMEKRCASPLKMYNPLHVAFIQEAKRKPCTVLACGTSAVGCKNKHSPVGGPTHSISSSWTRFCCLLCSYSRYSVKTSKNDALIADLCLSCAIRFPLAFPRPS